jgi:hypothetical protein
MDILEMYRKSTLEAALNEFGEKYAKFCDSHTCTSCPLAPAVISPLDFRAKCKALVIDHLTEANKKMDEAIAKAKEVKRKKDEYTKKLLLAIKDGKRDLEYHAKRDADYVILNLGDYALLKSCATWSSVFLTDGTAICYENLYGMRIVCDVSVKRGEFVIGFKTDSHLKEVTE